ncbi:MAG: site-2 protease family protein [Cellvibrio sp.]|uniref:site-2 protease family protein n=1 Tax=Cellvibrio sp. TaxID=1965322 RepID=UPI0027273A19|nr:site-2 protease family protein [Cellvibrio sp.]
MQLFSFDYADRQFRVDATPATGEEIISVDGVVVSQQRNFGITSEHTFVLEAVGEVKLIYVLNMRAADVNYELWVNAERVLEAAAPVSVEQQESFTAAETAGALQPDQLAVPAAAPAKTTSWLSIGLIAFKLLKAVQVFKVALLAASVAVYSVMFTLEFALVLIGVLVFHEYGHLRAMKKCGLPTKGMYLIPFVGGLAVGDMPKSRWQDVYISMMGPVYGLLMTVSFYIVYLITESHFAGLVASTSALLNLFNLIPVHPLDGGRVVKSLVFSGRNYLALVALLAISAACFVVAWQLGFYFIMFFIVLGVVDIVSGWRLGLAEDLPPLNAYGIWFSVLWYLVVVAMFLGMIVLIAQDGLPGSEIALKVLAS